MRRRLKDGETDFPGDQAVLTLGGGTEIWWKHSITADLAVRYYGFVHGANGRTDLSHNVQVSAGLHFYTSR
jgi:hypothetical protein